MFWGNNYWISPAHVPRLCWCPPPPPLFLSSSLLTSHATSSLIFLFCVAIPTSPALGLLSRNFGTVYWSISLSLNLLQGIAPVLIVFHVVQGRAWSQYTLHSTNPAAERTSHSIANGSFSLPRVTGGRCRVTSAWGHCSRTSARGVTLGQGVRRAMRVEKRDGQFAGGWGQSGSLADGWGTRANVDGGLKREKSEDVQGSLSMGGSDLLALASGGVGARRIGMGTGGDGAEGTQRRSRSRSRRRGSV
ncbi:hypothetical protein C8R44DRAFT_746434 [Mycena epipterygia]|nr:hypothetical protein C8R44DRAFT_746434 [Mycena epipterygia]